MERTSNDGNWVKLRHERRMQGEGTSCRVLLDDDYKRSTFNDGDWGECEIMSGIVEGARDQAEVLLGKSVFRSAYSKDGIAFLTSVIHPDGERIGWSIRYGDTLVLAGSRGWLEREAESRGILPDGAALEDLRELEAELARMAVIGSGLVRHLQLAQSA